MSRATFKILFYLKRNAPKKNGLIPVMCRITVNGKIAQFSCKLDVEEKMWSVETGRLTGRSNVAGILAGEAGRKREKHRGWRNAPRGSLMGGATDKGKALLSCRRDRSPATVIVMRAWLAVASFPPAAHVFKRSCLPCPVWQKHGKTV